MRFVVAGSGYAPGLAATVIARQIDGRGCHAFFGVIFDDGRQPWGETYAFWPVLAAMRQQGVIICDYHAFYFYKVESINLLIGMYYHST
ncbi:hypothetical protein [Vogesella indigofera]|uniref:hypothetical protein n=1 Tax=Vogesella indigofera TaxID=45465 RepID=UPI00234E7AAD|nr:hypothetical protein [Vogesella indigofera]MDC7697932.1 hypothetical protein [Vogesella indigofera]